MALLICTTLGILKDQKKITSDRDSSENDYIMELLNQHFGHIPSPTNTKIWIGLTKDENQTTKVYDRKNNSRDVNLTSVQMAQTGLVGWIGNEFFNWDTGGNPIMPITM